MPLIRNAEVNAIILQAMTGYLSSHNSEELQQALADYSLPSPLAKHIHSSLLKIACTQKTKILNQFVRTQRKEDAFFGNVSSRWIVYDSPQKLERLIAQNGRRVDQLNEKMARAEHNYTVLPSGYHYVTPSKPNECLFSEDDYYYQRRQYFDMNERIKEIRDPNKKKELRDLFNLCFMGQAHNPVYCPKITYRSTLPQLTKKLYWARQLQTVQDELNALNAWSEKPKMSQTEYSVRKNRLRLQLPSKPTTEQKLEYLLCSNREQYVAKAKMLDEAYGNLTPAECNQIIVHLLNRVKKSHELTELDIPSIKQFCATQNALITLLKRCVDGSRHSIMDKTLKDILLRIASIELDSDASVETFYLVINEWQKERSPYDLSKTNGQMLKPNRSLPRLFKSSERSILERLFELIPRLSNQPIPGQQYIQLEDSRYQRALL
ncbi:hypothetical protein [Legionella waltersii]|uniref:Uncharacterized protein n=1 Tax=Legionella waltersii TaxID=66969 RepID=A0A0W1ABU5_9GAMM|nr:hypothetical protein [Legionella waltersii]KTD78760.1 hypothetical protein Lwal_1530 [Legionella waltersii]SNV11275.1 Uncharacterised protein [Legionella waltersii]